MALSLFSAESASEVLDCEPALVYEILTDWNAYSQWMPLVSVSKLLAEEGDLAIAEMSVNLNEGETLAIECICDRNRMVLSRAIGGSLPVEKLEWNLEPAGEARTKVSLAMYPEERWQTFLPSHRRFLNPAGCLAALRRHVGLYSERTTVAGELVFQLRESAEGLEAWYQGKRYKMVPVEDGGQPA